MVHPINTAEAMEQLGKFRASLPDDIQELMGLIYGQDRHANLAKKVLDMRMQEPNEFSEANENAIRQLYDLIAMYPD